MNCDKIGNCDQCPRWFDEGKDFCKCCGFDLNSYNQPEEEEEERIQMVDDPDMPNIYPYKKCKVCEGRSSCGSYNEDRYWICEDCTPEEEEEECICESDKKPNPLCPDQNP